MITQKRLLFLSKDMNIDISHDDLDRTYRIGKTDRNDGKLRPIIIKFVRYSLHKYVYRYKKELKDKNFQIVESLLARKSLIARKSVYPKCHFVFLLNLQLKFKILISEFRFYTKFEE